MVVLGIDIGSNQIRAGIVDEEGAILASRTIQTPQDLDTFLPSLRDAIRWLVESTAVPAGVGVGCKGRINPDTTQIESLRGPLHFLKGCAWWISSACPSRCRFSPITTRAWRWQERWSGVRRAGWRTSSC